MQITIVSDGLELDGEITEDDGQIVAFSLELGGWEQHGIAQLRDVRLYGPRMRPWREVRACCVTWTWRRDLDNLETWE